MNPRILTLILFGAILWESCAGFSQDIATIGSAIVTCTKAECGGANPAPACTALETDVLTCLASLCGPQACVAPAVCLAAMPSLASVGFADLTCVLDDLATRRATASATVQAAPETATTAAAMVLAKQRLTVKRVGP